jgi:hypothetical protein
MRNVPRLLGAALALVLALASLRAAAEPQYAWLRGWDARGHSFDLSSLRGQVVALTFVSRETRDEATDINDELSQHARPGDVTVVSVVDLEDVPQIGRKSAHKKIAESELPGRLRFVVDPNGALAASFRVDARHEVPIFVIGRDGQVLGRFSGERGLDEAIRLMDSQR